MTQNQTANSTSRAPYTGDIVGSFLRPAYLLKARDQFQANEIGRDELTAIEDRAVGELMDKLKGLGYVVATDGEFPRGWYHSDFLAGLNGVTFTTFKMNLFGEETTVGSTALTDRISWNPEHPFLAQFKRAKLAADARGLALKFDIPGPNMVLNDTITTDQPNWYGKDVEKLAGDFVEVYRAAIRAFYDEGCRYLQLDDPVWVAVCDAGFRTRIEAAGFKVDRIRELFFDTASAILADKPDDMAITTHLCQGNLRSRKFFDATYDEIAPTIFKLPFDGFFMEFDEEKLCGDFHILDALQGQKMILGIVSTQTGELEDKNVLIDRIRRAAKHVPLEQLGISTQCGFASSAEGNLITMDDQWAKLKLLKEVEHEVWG